MSFRHSLRLSVCLLIATAGCKPQSDDFLDAVPEQAGLQMDLTGDATAEGTTNAAAEEAIEAMGSTSQGLATGVAPHLGKVRDTIRDLNQALRAHLEPIAALIREKAPSTLPGQIRVWGPVTRGSTDYEFIMRRGLVARRFGWVLKAKPTGSADTAYVNVAAGAITVGVVVRRGVGVVGFDLDALGSVDATVKARGKILAGFAHGPLGWALAYGLKGFSTDPAAHQPIDALFQGIHLVSGLGIARVAYHGDLPGSATSAEETVLARVRHKRGIGGRFDGIGFGGDIASGKMWVVNECWDAALAEKALLVRECPLGQVGMGQCTVVKADGDLATCIADFRSEELPPMDPSAANTDPAAPSQVDPPAAMPDGTGM
jgi:hypothetical protein